MSDNGLPVGWSKATVGSLVRLTNGFAFKPTDWKQAGLPIIRIQNLNNPAAKYNHCPDSLPDKYLVNEGNLLFAWSGTPGTSFGAHIWRGPQAWLNQHIFRVDFDERNLSKRFLQLAINFNLNEYIRAAHGGAGLAHITKGIFESSELLIPPLSEQHRIVEKIEEVFSDLDAGVAALERVKAKLRSYRAAVLKAAVEGRLTEDWRAKHPGVEPASDLLARILKERRRRWENEQVAKYAEVGKDAPRGWQGNFAEPSAPDTGKLPELPEGWCWSSIGQCFEVHVGATPSRSKPTYWGGKIPWVSSGLVQFCRIREAKEYITEQGLANSSTQLNPPGSVLLGMIGEGRTRGQAAILDIAACNNQNCAAIWVSETVIAPEFVYSWLWSRYEVTRRSSSGNNQPALNRTRVEQIPFPLPPLDEQFQIVQEVERRLSIVDELETEIKANLNRAARLRQSILKRAFEGRLVSQDPADEPAEKLLERIRQGSQVASDQPPRKRRSSPTKDVLA